MPRKLVIHNHFSTKDHFTRYDNINGHVIWRGYQKAAWEKGGQNPDEGKAMIMVGGQKKIFPSLGDAIAWARQNKARDSQVKYLGKVGNVYLLDIDPNNTREAGFKRYKVVRSPSASEPLGLFATERQALNFAKQQ